MSALTIDTSSSTGSDPHRNAHGLRVFLVEDLPAVRNLVIETLREIEGLNVAGFADSEDEALAWLGQHECDVLILDLELKQGNGIGVLQKLGGVPTQPSLVKIVYSNHVNSNIRRLAARSGASFFFDKTLDAPQLRLLLEKLSAAKN